VGLNITVLNQFAVLPIMKYVIANLILK